MKKASKKTVKKSPRNMKDVKRTVLRKILIAVGKATDPALCKLGKAAEKNVWMQRRIELGAPNNLTPSQLRSVASSVKAGTRAVLGAKVKAARMLKAKRDKL